MHFKMESPSLFFEFSSPTLGNRKRVLERKKDKEEAAPQPIMMGLDI